MYKSSFGTKGQIRFNLDSDFYEFLGYLAKNDGSTRIVWENNDEQGAWGQEGRIEFFDTPPGALSAILIHTAGNTSVSSRVNCNEFVENIINDHNFAIRSTQNIALIRATIPGDSIEDFDRGLHL